MMYRNGLRLLRALHSGWTTRYSPKSAVLPCQRCRLLSSAESDQSVSYQHANLDVTNKADDASEIKASRFDHILSQKAVVKRAKPLTREPFVKNLFLGKFDTTMLIFPEILEKKEVEELNQMAEEVERFFKEKVDSQAIDREAQIPFEVLQHLKEFGMFGLEIPLEHGGWEFNATQIIRMAEVTGNDAAVDLTLGTHQNHGLKGILMHGTDEQKAKYLPTLATGEHVAAFCLTESGSSGSDPSAIKTTATLSDDGKTYVVNGEKILVTNGRLANLFTVFAKTQLTAPVGKTEERITAFIVEREFGGVISGQPDEKHGIRGSDNCSVTFDNTPVPVENIIGVQGEGFRVAMSILNSSRYIMGPSSVTAITTLLAQTVKHAISRKPFGKPLTDYGLIQLKLANIEMDTYIMESMGYVTAGILDSVKHPDAAIESAIVKVFSSEATVSAANECLQIMGGRGYTTACSIERHLRDARALLIHQGTNEVLRLFISLTCLQYAGLQLIESVKKIRDPLNNLSFMFKKNVERMKIYRKNPKLLQALYDHVHPDLSYSAEALETRLVQFQCIVEKYLSMFADKLNEEQMALKRIADIAIDLYAITSVLARASRSKSIGLQHCDHEVFIANMITTRASRRIDHFLEELEAGKFCNTDEEMRQIAEYMFKHGGYVPRHPLTRNW